MDCVATRPGFIDKRKSRAVFGELFCQLHDSVEGVGNVPVKTHLAVPGIGDRHGNAVLVDIESDEFGIMGHGLFSCILALGCEWMCQHPSQSNPRCAGWTDRPSYCLKDRKDLMFAVLPLIPIGSLCGEGSVSQENL